MAFKKLAQHSKIKLNVFEKLSWPKPAVIAGIIIFFVSILSLVWRLSSLTVNKLSFSEITTKHNLFIDSPWWKSLEFIYGPYYALLHITFAIDQHSLFTLRLASTIIGLLSTMLVYWLITKWHGYKIAILATLAYLSSFGVLALSRQANPTTTYLLMPIALLSIITIITHHQNIWSIVAFIIIISGCIYIPGALWLVIASIILAYPYIKKIINHIDYKKKIALLIFNLLLIAPLLQRLFGHFSSHQLAQWLGYGLNGRLLSLSALSEFATNLSTNFLSLFIHSTKLGATLSLGHLPLLPIAESLIIIIGIIFYLRHINNQRWQIWIGLSVFTIILSGFGLVSILSLLPLLAIALATGLAYLLREWYAVFPFNPFARYAGYILMSIVVLFCCFYSARSYYVAWANNPTTTSQYRYYLH